MARQGPLRWVIALRSGAPDLKRQVELLRRDYREIAEVLRGVGMRSRRDSRRGNSSAGRSGTMALAASFGLSWRHERMGRTDWEEA